MTTEIFIRSYRNDFEWLGYCLRSIQQFANAFSGVTIVVPLEDKPSLSHLTAETVFGTFDICEGYLAQQITKLEADKYTDKDFILHVDSDCIFFEKTTPEDFFIDGKPIMLMEQCESPWPTISKRTLGWLDEYEYMRRLPIIYPRWIYEEFRRWIRHQHSTSLATWIASQPYREFSEFNTLGQWARKFHPEAFTWMHPKDVPVKCRQFWSWGGVDIARKEIESLLQS